MVVFIQILDFDLAEIFQLEWIVVAVYYLSQKQHIFSTNYENAPWNVCVEIFDKETLNAVL